MKLYEINEALEALVDPETGELLDYEAFAELQLARDEKIEGMALWYKDLTAEAKAIKEETDNLTARRKAIENKADRLKSYLQEALCGEKFQTPRCDIRYRKSTALEVNNIDAAAEWLEGNGYMDMVTYSAPSIDKRAVSSLVKDGIKVEGVELVERQSMTVR